MCGAEVKRTEQKTSKIENTILYLTVVVALTENINIQMFRFPNVFKVAAGGSSHTNIFTYHQIFKTKLLLFHTHKKDNSLCAIYKCSAAQEKLNDKI